MILQRTVLVLGAGASMDYGYPSGADLRKLILDELLGSNSVLEKTLQQSGCELDRIPEFRDALQRSGVGSVDLLLEYRPELIPIGKVAIAATLSKFERLERLWDDGWYQHLFSHMGGKFEDFGSNALSIVTFNYDRSFDEFLFQSVLYKYGRSELQTAEIVKRIPIIHVHGSLGLLPWQLAGAYRYGPPSLPGDIRAVSSSIKIIHEDTESEDLRLAQMKLNEAEQIVFVGFGYHETNMKRLLGDTQLSADKIIGSFVGMTHLERISIQSNFNQFLLKPGVILLGVGGSKNALEFLRSEVILS